MPTSWPSPSSRTCSAAPARRTPPPARPRCRRRCVAAPAAVALQPRRVLTSLPPRPRRRKLSRRWCCSCAAGRCTTCWPLSRSWRSGARRCPCRRACLHLFPLAPPTQLPPSPSAAGLRRWTPTSRDRRPTSTTCWSCATAARSTRAPPGGTRWRRCAAPTTAWAPMSRRAAPPHRPAAPRSRPRPPAHRAVRAAIPACSPSSSWSASARTTPAFGTGSTLWPPPAARGSAVRAAAPACPPPPPPLRRATPAPARRVALTRLPSALPLCSRRAAGGHAHGCLHPAGLL